MTKIDLTSLFYKIYTVMNSFFIFGLGIYVFVDIIFPNICYHLFSQVY
jgi:hypothetical protein